MRLARFATVATAGLLTASAAASAGPVAAGLASTRQAVVEEGREAPAAAPASPLVAAVGRLKFQRDPAAILAAATRPTTRAASQPTDPAARAAALQSDVIAGRWDAVGDFFKGVTPLEADPIYLQLLTALNAPPPGGQPGQPQQMTFQDGEMVPTSPAGGGGAGGLLADDVLALAAAYPPEPTDAQVAALGALLKSAGARAAADQAIADALRSGRGRFGGAETADRRRAAELLFAADMDAAAGDFLPPLPESDDEIDDPSARAKLLNDHARVAAARAAAQAAADAAAVGKGAADLEELRQLYRNYGWPVPANLAAPGETAKFYAGNADALASSGRVLRLPDAPEAARSVAVARAAEMLGKVPDDAAARFVTEIVREDSASAATLAAGIADAAAKAAAGRDVAAKGNALVNQKRLADALLGGGNEPRWANAALRVMAETWLSAAKATLAQPSAKQAARGGGRRTLISPGGGSVTVMTGGFNGRNQTPAVADATLLDDSPMSGDGRWFDALDAALRPALLGAQASLLSREDRPTEAVAAVRKLAAAEPAAATDLTPTLLKNWAAAANPNPPQDDQQQQYASYGGSPQPPTGIALTRLRQQRNLRQLSAMLADLNALPGGGPPAEAVADAFVAAHSAAEVFRPEDVTTIFGPAGDMDAAQLAALTEAMRERLASQWRKPDAQTQAGTKRDDKALAAEIGRGYALAVSLADGRKDNWRTQLSAAATLFDWNEYQYGRGMNLADYTGRRDAAFARFQGAAGLYAAAIADGTVSRADESADPYVKWFLSALGASDLAQLTRQTTPQMSQVAAVRAAMDALPGDAAARHLSLFAAALDAQAATIPPELKERTMRAELQVVGADAPEAAKAREAVRYYDDLLGEMQLLATLDSGQTAVGTEPFGLHLGMRHTDAVGRESGGFGRFLQQPNAQTAYYVQQVPGQIDRDRLERYVRDSLSEKFDLISITWHAADIKARGDPAGEPGWRYTPLAFVLLKAKDPSADRVPPVRMDLNFRDTAGQVVLPLESPVVAINARTAPTDAAASLANVSVTETLDESLLAKEGKLTLDVRASADGLLPKLEDVVDVSSLSPWTVASTDGGDLTVGGLDLESARVRPKSERAWLLTLRPPAGVAGAKLADLKLPPPRDGLPMADGSPVYQRYEGSDLTPVSADVALSALPLGTRAGLPIWAWWLIASTVTAAAVSAAWLWVRRREGKPSTATARYAVPRDLTPFTLVTVLRRMDRDGAADGDAESLRGDIRKLEQSHFAPDAGGEPESLHAVARRWLTPT